MTQDRLTRALALVERTMEERRLRLTDARRQIVRTAIDLPGYFRAEQLLEAVPQTSISSVYRMIPVMVEAGLLRESQLPTPHGRFFEAAFEREVCDQLRCVDCGATIAYPLPGLEELKSALCAQFGFKLTGRRFEGYGYCRDCRGTRRSQG